MDTSLAFTCLSSSSCSASPHSLLQLGLPVQKFHSQLPLASDLPSLPPSVILPHTLQLIFLLPIFLLLCCNVQSAGPVCWFPSRVFSICLLVGVIKAKPNDINRNQLSGLHCGLPCVIVPSFTFYCPSSSS